MARFPSASHLVSWATLCPRAEESAGRHRSTRIRKGANWLKPMLVQAAWSAVRKKNSYERSLFLRLKGRRGPLKAIVAVAASMLRAIFYILRDKVPYRDLGPAHFDTADREQAKKRLVHRLKTLGYQVDIREAA
ncbi:transposase [Myxococcota bacterium]|nr:transposase [Myxococcota bacterium]